MKLKPTYHRIYLIVPAAVYISSHMDSRKTVINIA